VSAWVANISAEPKDSSDLNESLWRFSQILEALAGAAERSPTGLSATFSVGNAADAQIAAERAADLFQKLANDAGLPAPTIVNLQVMTEAHRDLVRPPIPNLIGIAEVAELLDVSRQRASELARQPSFPRPIAQLRSGPVWIEPAIQLFSEQWNRQPGRPKRFRIQRMDTNKASTMPNGASAVAGASTLEEAENLADLAYDEDSKGVWMEIADTRTGNSWFRADGDMTWHARKPADPSRV
jgi:hypothetical protein